MISVMNTDCELDRKPDVAADMHFFGVEPPEKTRVSGDTLSRQRIDVSNGDSISGDGGRVSGETRVSPNADFGESKSKSEVRASGRDVASGRTDVSDVGIPEVTETASEEAKISSDINYGVGGRVIDDGPFEVKTEDLPPSGGNDYFSVHGTGMEHLTTGNGEGARVSSIETKGDVETMEGNPVSDFDSSYPSLCGCAATEMPGSLGAEAAKALPYGFEIGDMVWGKVKSHPWWPGHIYNEAFASSSVRRSKREGYILVAFFGDSSYGWFDPAELIPFDPHYAEKSRQTNSRNFIKAVEEAIDEASRRRALGLTCFCRNPFNFRPASLPGYFVVDVGGYEPGGVYSLEQVKKARDSFQPVDTLSFVQKLALMPQSTEQRSIDWIKSMATVLAYRKAVFEEFDATYAEAFGMQPVRPSRDPMGLLDQPAKVPSRAPLSGPLVIAESLGEKKGTAKTIKVKDQSKKDKYVLKRRDEPNDARAYHINQGQASFLVPSAFKDGTSTLGAGEYVLQRRAPVVSTKTQVPGRQDQSGIVGGEGAVLNQGVSGQEENLDKKPMVSKLSSVDVKVSTSQVDLQTSLAAGLPTTQPTAYGHTPETQVGPEDKKFYQDKEVSALREKGKIRSDNCSSTMIGDSEPSSLVSAEHKNTKLSSTFEVLERPKQRMPTTLEDHHQPMEVQVGCNVTHPLSLGPNPLDRAVGVGSDGASNRVNVLKCPSGYPVSEKSTVREKKKKKKKELGLETGTDHPPKRLKTSKDAESLRKSAGKSIGIGLVPQEDPQKKVDGVSSPFPLDASMAPPVIDIGDIDVELPQLVGDLLALALDPFYGVERNGPAIVRHVLLRFRSLVYQKSLILVPPTESAETSDFRTNRSSSGGASGTVPNEDVKDLPSARPPKHLSKVDDPTKAGRKRSLSDRQEEIAVKRMKKLNELKLMTEKKAGSQKAQEMQRGERKDGKDAGTTILAKQMRPDYEKKPEPPARIAEPTMLVMKFPPRTSLPSVPELKARFARFGPLDHSATRVFWKSSTCRVVFKHKSHAQVAHSYAVRNSSLFGNVKVNYHLRELEAPTPEMPDSGKWRAEVTSDEVQSRTVVASDTVNEPRPRAALKQQPTQPSVQLKSCLKKPSGDESGHGMGGVTRESPRVKFMLGGEESGRGEQVVVSSSNNNNNGSNADGGGASSSLAMDVNTKNFQKVIPSLPPFIPLPPRIPDVHESRGVVGHLPKSHHLHFSEVETRNNYNNNNQNSIPITTTTTIDISHQMLSLLMRCSDIVTDVKSTLGYVPYHPL
ncbi:PREDICTED: uncharacterized protein LOC104599005 [Nelumbo nucifera]|uniref:PWWP domain-containing protein n=2 Tax=Nelumbo nucifera TaxID=4432 RepID=A0A822Z3K1_NELNU|nr:PREDICTED: uncharacterized protein LOC104599005 [Nelumbo nucifera]DAD38029.1 TPA_asm: hypothetical protein HUJ06_008670 [Nelumbo nucifera]